MTKTWLFLLACCVYGPNWGTTAFAAGKKKPEPPQVVSDGKRVVSLENIKDVRIELPNHEVKDFGQGFQAKLTRRLIESGKYIVSDPEQIPPVQATALARGEGAPDYHWTGKFVPAANLKVVVDAMSFVSGGRGSRMFYGFDERMRTPFNDGFGTLPNEFPMRSVVFEPNWMDRTFDEKGGELFGSHAGLDLGEGFNINVLFAFLNLKYASYRSEIHLRVFVDAPLAGRNEYRDVRVKGNGYYYDVAGGYMQYSLGITIARSDAMLQAMNNALEATLGVFDRALENLPLTAGIDAILPSGEILIGTGFRAGIKPGTLYQLVEDPTQIIEVTSSVDDGSIGKVVRGNIAALFPGAKLKQVHEIGVSEATQPKVAAALAGSSLSVTETEPKVQSRAPALVASESIDLKGVNFPKPDLHGSVPEMSFFQAFLKSLEGLVFLPYRIWRYFSYDETLHQSADGDLSELVNAQNWSVLIAKDAWARKIGLDPSKKMAALGTNAPVVAIIDTGIDYNHPALNSRIWINPAPWEDPSGRKDRYGWDFISADSRPYDDAYHGTQIAGSVLAVAPEAQILPIKIFNPWGITSSAAVYSAFKYATDRGAKIILVAWATRVASKALEMGIQYAREHGVLVVAAAGDRGDRLSEIASYPGSLSKKYPNVLCVTSVDSQDQLVRVSGRFANFGPDFVQIAAPGQDIRVAEPRLGFGRDTSSGIAAALTAGAIARIAAMEPEKDFRSWMDELLERADRVPGLESYVAQGRRLRIHD